MAHKIWNNFSNNTSNLVYRYAHNPLASSQFRSIFATSHLSGSWLDSIKGVFSGSKSDASSQLTEENFTLPHFADAIGQSRKLKDFKNYVVGRGSDATFADAFEKHEEILRYLGKLDPTGENIQISQKQEAVKHLKCTMLDVENTLAKFTWAKEAHKKMAKLKEEGKSIPTNMDEIQKLMGNSPVDLARLNMAKSGQLSRNAWCPCGSKKRYKRCCGQDK